MMETVFVDDVGKLVQDILAAFDNADGTLLYIALPSVSKVVVETLSHCLRWIKGSIRNNKLKLKSNKAEILMIGVNLNLGSKVALLLDEAPLPLKVHVCSLGMFLDLPQCSGNKRL